VAVDHSGTSSVPSPRRVKFGGEAGAAGVASSLDQGESNLASWTDRGGGAAASATAAAAVAAAAMMASCDSSPPSDCGSSPAGSETPPPGSSPSNRRLRSQSFQLNSPPVASKQGHSYELSWCRQADGYVLPKGADPKLLRRASASAGAGAGACGAAGAAAGTGTRRRLPPSLLLALSQSLPLPLAVSIGGPEPGYGAADWR
jgi:hypothetical protein